MSRGEARALWTRLAAAGLVVGDEPESADAHVAWYVRVMLSVAGLVAAVFLIVFVASAFTFVIESGLASSAVGLMLVTAAYALFRTAPRGDFLAMFALAMSFAGQVLFFTGLPGVFERVDKGILWVGLAVFQSALVFLMPNFIHRVFSAFGAGFALTHALSWLDATTLAPGVIAAAVAWIWLNEARYAKRASIAIPAGYGLTLAFAYAQMSASGMALLGLFALPATMVWLPMWFAEALVGAALVATVAVLARRVGWTSQDRRTLCALAAAAAVALASFKAPGVAGGLMIALLGFSNGNRVLTGLGIAALLFYVSRYYYALDVTLLAKSAALALTGIVLLGARWIAMNVLLPQGERDA